MNGRKKMKDIFKYKLFRIGNHVFFQIIEQHKDVYIYLRYFNNRSKFPIRLGVESRPELYHDIVFLRGDRVAKDYIFTFVDLGDEDAAKDYVRSLEKAFDTLVKEVKKYKSRIEEEYS